MRYSHSLPPPSSDLNEDCEKNKVAGRKDGRKEGADGSGERFLFLPFLPSLNRWFSLRTTSAVGLARSVGRSVGHLNRA